MSRKDTPRYHGLRIYLTSTVLFFMLVFPFMIYLGLQNLPRLVDRGNGVISWNGEPGDSTNARTDTTVSNPALPPGPEQALADSMVQLADSLMRSGALDPANTGQLRELEEMAGELNERSLHSDPERKERQGIITVSEDDETYSAFDPKGPFARFFLWFFPLSLLAYLTGLFYNLPFKRYFKRKQKNREISPALFTRVKKRLLGTPWMNGLIIIIPNLLLILYSLVFMTTDSQRILENEKGLFIYFFLLTLVATLLEFLFAYYWQRHRVHMKYLDHVYTGEELKTKVFRRKNGRIRDRYLVASAITTFFPLLIVTGYLALSITSVRNMELDSLSKAHQEVLIGPWKNVINPGDEDVDIQKYRWLFYVNAIDSLLMIIGIGNGILVAFIYLLFLIRWTNNDIAYPVKELLLRMRNTREGETGQYAIVRTNDEIGELAEGYNEMTRQIHEHLQRISRMNRDLERKVKDRTKEVVQQKEEIEAQKEEIQAQLDLTTEQRDTIGRQNEQILDSIRYAEKIQAALLPPVWYLSETLSDHFVLFKPRDIVSGDYYWTAFKEGKLLIAVADCTGHGVPGAFLSIMGISAMNEIINRPGSLTPAEILEQLREFLIHTLHQTGERGETQDGIEIAMCIVDPVSQKVEFAGANRPLYLIRGEKKKSPSGRSKSPRKGNTKKTGTSPEVTQVKGDRMPIGIYEQDPMPFTSHELQLAKGDTLYLFSDGFVDQLGGPRRKTYRSVHFRSLLVDIQDKSMEDQKNILLKSHESWKGEVEQIDDILVVGIRL